MSLNEDVKSLIRCVADNDFQQAKRFVGIIINNEKASCNQYFCKIIKNKLETQHNFIELPGDIKGLLKMEDVSTTFNENRYYLTEQEKQLFNQIESANNTNKKLTEMGIRYLNATLLYGESGTGKTTFGKYIAYKLGLPFAYLNFSQCISSYLGSTSKNIEKVFDYISKQKCVLMLDEIDAIGIKRGTEDVGEMARIVIGLMQSFDLLENDVIVIGATNRKDMIDKALIRRFSMIHEVKELNNNNTYNLIINYLDDLKIEYDNGNILSYAKVHHKQSEIIKDITKSIIKMINNETVFRLEEDKQ